MRTNFVQTCKTSANRINLNRTAMRVALIGLFISLGIGNAWATDHYYTDFKATGGATGKGYVYAGTSNTATPAYVETSDDIDTSEPGSGKSTTYYAWAKAVRGADFKSWSLSSAALTTNNGGTADVITVTAPTSDGTTTGVATATWTTYTKVNVTYNPSEDGVYSVTYQYNSYDATNKEITTGDAENLSRTISSENGAQTIGSYKNDVITLKSTSGTFQGWYSDAGFTSLLSTANPYTYTAPTSGSAAVYPQYEHVDKYYGRLTASIAEVPYSMPGGGTIFVSKEEAGTGTYSADAQTVDNIGMGTKGLKYYLHAQPNDKRYVFRGWYSNPECTGTALSTSTDYTYTFTATSMNSADPTLGNVYAAFDFNLYYMQVEVEPAVPGLGMVLVKDNNTGTPDYTAYASHSEQFLYAYRLAPTANAYLYAKPKYGYKFSGWYDNPDCTGTAKSTANPYTYPATGSSTDPMNPTIKTLYAKFVEDATTVNITYNLPDQTKGEYTASVLDIAEVDDDFIWTFTQVFTSEGKTGNTTQAQHKIDVLRLEAQPKTGYGVTSWTIAGAAKTTPSQLYETSGTAAATYGVTFGDAKPFLVSAANATTGTQYATLAEALANLGSNKKITVVQNAYVPAGNYTIPSGVTLLIPYSEDYAINTEPSVVTKGTPNRSVYVTLTLGDGAIINVSGSVCANAVMCLTMGYNGSAMGKYGLIDMNTGSQMNFKNSSNCYAWGYVIGEGRITAESGATIHETFQFKHRGGTAMSSIAGAWGTESHKVFPINQYYIQSIESPILIKKGASEKVYTGVHNVAEAVAIDFIGENGLFQLTGTNAYLIKQYDVNLDRQKYTLYGDAKISSISFGMSGFSKESKDYVLPITNNMTLDIELGTTTIQYETAILPDVQISIGKGAKVLASGNCYVYDSLNWKGAYAYACQYSAADQTTAQIAPVVYRHGGLKYDRKKHKLRDVTIDVQGEMSGNIYTTTGGANIMSSGSGKVTFSASRTATTTYQVGQDGSSPTWDAYSLTSAQLHNGDGSYVQTLEATDADQFIYSKSQEKWLKNPKVVSWNANGGETEASTLAYSEGDFLGELPAAYKDGYTLEGWYTAADGGTQIDATTKVTANATYYAHWTPKSYSITYRDQGGVAFSGTHVDSPNAHPTTHTFGTATTLNAATKAGHTFGGWYRTPSCSGTVVTSIPASTCKNITLYAKWTEIPGEKYSLTIAATPSEYGTVDRTSVTNIPSGSAVTTSSNTFTVNGVTVTATPAAATAQYTYAFKQWNNLPATVTANVTNVQAEFTRTARSYNLTWVTDGDALTGTYTKGTVAYGTSITQPNTPTKTGYTFAGWHNGSSVVTPSTMPAANTTYTATWTEKTYSVTFYNGGHGTVQVAGATIANGGTASVNHFATKALTATASTGYTFAGWTTTGSVTLGSTSAASTTIKTTAAGGTVTATWTPISYTITYNNLEGASNSNLANYNIESANITLVDPGSRAGYDFVGWYTNEELTTPAGTPAIATGSTGAKTFWTKWTEKSYAVTFNNGGHGTVAVAGATVANGATASVNHFTTKSLEATASTGYTFAGWTTTGSVTLGSTSAASTTIKTTAAGGTVTATWTPISYTITYNNLEGASNSNLANYNIESANITLVDPGSRAGYDFVGWYTNEELTTPAGTPAIATGSTGAKTFWAKWTASIADRELDIVDWTSNSVTINSVTINVTNLKAVGGTNKNNWKIYANGSDYTRNDCSTTARTLTISGLSLTPNDNLLIQLKNDEDVIESQHYYKIPQIYTENATLSGTTSSSVVYVKGGKLTISDDITLAALYVCPGAEVEVTEGNTLTVDKLVLRTKPWATAAISGNVTATNVYYTRIAPDGSSEYPTGQYYQFGLPYECAISAVRLSDGTTPAYNTTWILKSYNEETRATNGATGENWDVLSSGTIAAGRGYEMFSSYKYYREYYFPVTPTGNTSVAVTRHGEDKNNSGWNIVCSPLMSIYHNESDPVDGLKVSWLLADGSYDQQWPETIWPALPFSYQASANGYLDFSSGDFNQKTVSAPRRAAYKENIQTEWLHLDVKDGNGVGDHTSVFVHPDRFEATYQTGIDVAKQSFEASRALLYSSHAYGEMAFAGVSDELLEQGVALTVYSPKEQELTISMRKNDWLNRMAFVWLIDQATGAQIDLLDSDYSFNAEAGTTAGRFILMGAFFAPQITTDNGNVQSDDEHIKVTKFIYNDKMYIQINGVIYDATGKLVK